MTIYLIRHGKTPANEQRLYCGKTDISLSEAGRAALTGISYDVPKGSRYITSGMRRTSETLEILFGNVPCEQVPEFQEMDFGRFEMHSYEQLKEDQDYLAWITGDNDANLTPGGESGVLMKNRVLAAFDRISGEDRNTVIITHGGVIAVIMEYLFPAEQKSRYQWQSTFGSGYRLTKTAGGWTYSDIKSNRRG